jgi:transcriptional regulator with PAS, ATPase and Fis domain
VIYGESGTGKELVARALHHNGPRAQHPFVSENCAAIPETLLEAALFGHARGAFTGATHSRAGRFQLADGGTIFLDEIGDMPLAFQVKLLRVLQERRFEILGDGTTRSVDVRVVAATHRDLEAMVREGSFREDLFYRLNVIDVKLPPLRDRRGDIPLLVEQFLAAANERHGRHVTGVHPQVMARFGTYGWPGNIRELANLIEKMVVLKRGGGELQESDLPPQLTGAGGGAGAGGERPALPSATLPPDGLDLRQALASYEDSLIDQALTRTGGNRNAAALLLGLNRTTLVEKLRRKK